MWKAIEFAAQRVQPGGLFWLAIYNDQGAVSRFWRLVKSVYVRLPRWLQTPYVGLVGGLWVLQRLVRRGFRSLAQALPGPRTPARRAASQRSRGMHLWYDLVDWIGGYPFEVAKPEDVFRCLHHRGFQLEEMSTCGGDLGCNEFVFRRTMA
jgi:2-polyprenyl-6-hydroxyphenyl methylase/3-demethylubiquinone-9 3-methyltransferase